MPEAKNAAKLIIWGKELDVQNIFRISKEAQIESKNMDRFQVDQSGRMSNFLLNDLAGYAVFGLHRKYGTRTR